MRRLLLTLVLIAACDRLAPTPSLELSFSVVSGDGQTGTVGTALPQPLVVKATDSRGKAIRNLLVEFRVTSGGGAANPASASTNQQGYVQTTWTLGTSTAVPQRLEVRAVSTGQLFGAFTASALPGSAAGMIKSAGDSQSVPRLTSVPIAPAVLVADQYGNPVPGVSVTFSVLTGGGSLIGSTPVTGASGVATVGGWTLGATVGAQTLRAAVANVSPVTFTATATIGAGARMVLHAGDNQNAPVHWNLAVPPAVRITDGAGNPIQGIQTTFSRVDTNSVFVDSMPVSDSNGVARVQAWTMGSRLGLVAARVTAPGIADTVLLSARATAGIPASITIAGGNDQSAHVGYAVATPPSVLVKDSSNNPVQGYGVQFVVTSGGGSIFGSSTTDSSGIARAGVWFLGPNPGPNTLRATVAWVAESVEFTATGTVGPVDSANTLLVVDPSTITASTGSEVATITLTARDALNRPVPFANVVFHIGAGTFADTTDANGVATLAYSSTSASFKLVYGVVDGVATIRRYVIVQSAAPYSIAVNAGANQTAVAGTPVAIQPAVVVRDTFGNGANTVGVSFAVTGGGGSISAPGTVNTTAFGIATIGGWTLGVTPGANSLSATVVGTPLTTTFNATGTPNAASIDVYAGDGQSAEPRTEVAVPPAVIARDAGGDPMSGAVVDFAVAAGSGYISGPATRTTGPGGTAGVDAWTLGEYATNRLTARVRGTDLSVTFTATGAGSQWDRVADLPTPRIVPGAATANGVVYAVGGLFDAYVANVDAFDPATNTWTPRAPMPTVRGEIGVGVVNGVLYAVGGNNGSGYDVTTLRATVEAYDPATNTWTTRAPMPTPRAGLAVVVVDGVIYAIGGIACRPPEGESCVASSPVGLVATVEAYDPATNSWTTKASMPTPRAYLGAAAIGGVIYAAGGQGDASLFIGDVEAYNPSLDTWTVRAPLPTRRLGLGAEVVNGQLYAIGGYGAGYFEGRTVEAYDAASDTWTALPPMPVGRWFLATTVLNGVIYVIGGSGGAEVVETFRP